MTLFNTPRAERDLDRELRGYVQLLIEEKIRAGMSPEDARRAALIETGGVEQVKERVRDVRPGVFVERLMQDVRYALRTLRHSPAFTTVAVLTLALGIGANTAIFSIVNGVLLQPLPYPEPERLVSVTSVISGASTSVSPRDFMDWRRDARSFSGLAASYSSETILTGSGDAERFTQARVTANAFDVLSVRPILGRAFVEGRRGRPGSDAMARAGGYLAHDAILRT
jgi:hypothetical protein